MKLAVCGCSWSSRDKTNPGFEFGQIISNYYNFDEYKNFAVPGCSNFFIALQIEQALKEDFDFFIVNATTVTREDFRIKGSDRYDPKMLTSNLNTSLHSNSFGTIFDDNLEKTFQEVSRYEHSKDLTSVFDESTHALFKKWFLYFYDADIARHKQYYLLQCALYKILNAGKTVYFSPNTFEWAECYQLKTQDSSSEYSVEDYKWDLPPGAMHFKGVSGYLDVCDQVYGDWQSSTGTIMSNHLPPESHQAYAADSINQINKFNLINNST